MNQIVHLPRLVLMAGLPGVGKTTLAEALGRELRWPVIDKDSLKLSFLHMGETDIQAGILAYEVVFTLVRDLMVRQKLSLIIDTASMHLFILEHATKIACDAQACLKIILCVVESDIRDQRLKQRIGAIAQHCAEPATMEQDRQRFVHLPSNTLILHTLSPLQECVTRARCYVMDEKLPKMEQTDIYL